jgi:DNA ligase 1
MTNFKPMLAATIDDVAQLRYPLLGSAKLDGIRAMVIDGFLLSRNLKPIPNTYLQEKFGRDKFNGLDGELIAGAHDSEVFRRTTGIVMSKQKDGERDVVFHVFDSFAREFLHFPNRIALATRAAQEHPDIRVVGHSEVTEQSHLDYLEELALEDGYEGLMLRAANMPYKFGRSTFKEHGLLKLKRFADAEAEIIGFEEQLKNNNEKTIDALGRSKRTTHKANKAGKGTLGALVVLGLNGPYKGVEFNIGSGFDDALRLDIWEDRAGPIGAIVKYKYFPTGSKDAPRFPVFLGFREDL